MYQRYMDVIITTTKTTEVNNKLSEINQLHDNLKFTTETETEGRLPFLDLCIVHSENELFTTWYSKPTDTGLIMNFHAVAPRRYKRAVVQGFLSSTESFALAAHGRRFTRVSNVQNKCEREISIHQNSTIQLFPKQLRKSCQNIMIIAFVFLKKGHSHSPCLCSTEVESPTTSSDS